MNQAPCPSRPSAEPGKPQGLPHLHLARPPPTDTRSAGSPQAAAGASPRSTFPSCCRLISRDESSPGSPLAQVLLGHKRRDRAPPGPRLRQSLGPASGSQWGLLSPSSPWLGSPGEQGGGHRGTRALALARHARLGSCPRAQASPRRDASQVTAFQQPQRPGQGTRSQGRRVSQ